MPSHTFTLSTGEVVTVEGSEQLLDYIGKVRIVALDPASSINDVIDVVYSHDNPLTEPLAARFADLPHAAGAAVISTDKHKTPAWRVMADLMTQKRMMSGEYDPPPTGKGSPPQGDTITPNEAAARLGISAAAVRLAMRDGRLDGRKAGGRWRVSVASVEAYQPTTRGPGNKLKVSVGHDRNFKFTLRMDPGAHWHDDRVPVIGKLGGEAKRGIVTDWGWASVLTAKKREDGVRSYRWHVLVPDDEHPNTLRLSSFHVAGRFRVVHVESGTKPPSRWKDRDNHNASVESIIATKAA